MKDPNRLSDEQLLIEVDDILRTMPDRATLRHENPENFAWLGRAAAAIDKWNSTKAMAFQLALAQFHQSRPLAGQGFRQLITLLHEARHALRLRTTGPLNIAVSQWRVFDYFDELRKFIELARQDLFLLIRTSTPTLCRVISRTQPPAFPFAC